MGAILHRAGRLRAIAACTLAAIVIFGGATAASAKPAHYARKTPAQHASHKPVAHHKPTAHRKPTAHHKPVAHRRPLSRRKPAPWRLSIPRIGVSVSLLRLPAPSSSALPVPSLRQASLAGWYDFTAVPGTPGNSVIVGHVDTVSGPAVFYNLYLLRPGDTIFVTLGTAARRERFTVTWVAEVPKSEFPGQAVFGRTQRRQLRLITCGGNFDYQTRHYLDNIIVGARLAPARHSGVQ
jgi:sortase (surface protein transpeptidase)